MSFSEALTRIKAGARASRLGWNGRGMWVAIQRPDKHSMMGLPYLYMKTADDRYVPWVVSQTDLLAEDWIIVEY